MVRIPFDFCDKCEDRFPIFELREVREDDELFYFCQKCKDNRPDSWRKAKAPTDDYDRRTKSEEDR